jgi:hypothetical protein
MFYALLKTKAKMRSLNVHNKDMDNCCLTIEDLSLPPPLTALNSGASPNLRRERLSTSRTGFTLKKKELLSKLSNCLKWILHLKVYISNLHIRIQLMTSETTN